MIVVSNSSPLITLSIAGQLRLLREFYGNVLIPEEVYVEVAIVGAGLPGASEVRGAEWIERRSLPAKPSESLKRACAGLGVGERGAIHLASTVSANLVLIDEARARRVARRLGLTVAGSLAILESGARLGVITDLRSVYSKLLAEGIYFEQRLLDESLSRLGIPKLES